jgi:hypothetical protein
MANKSVSVYFMLQLHTFLTVARKAKEFGHAHILHPVQIFLSIPVHDFVSSDFDSQFAYTNSCQLSMFVTYGLNHAQIIVIIVYKFIMLLSCSLLIANKAFICLLVDPRICIV